VQDYEVRFSGSGGQGLQLSAKILAHALNLSGKRIAQSQSYEPTSRGGLSRSDLVVSDGIAAFPLVTSLDYLVVLDQNAVSISLDLLNDHSTVIVDERFVPEPPTGAFRLFKRPFNETAVKLGNVRVANIISLGALVGASDICSYDLLEKAVQEGVPAKFLDLNLEAVRLGYQMLATKTLTGTA